jgi:hypothetical protein
MVGSENVYSSFVTPAKAGVRERDDYTLPQLCWGRCPEGGGGCGSTGVSETQLNLLSLHGRAKTRPPRTLKVWFGGASPPMEKMVRRCQFTMQWARGVRDSICHTFRGGVFANENRGRVRSIIFANLGLRLDSDSYFTNDDGRATP